MSHNAPLHAIGHGRNFIAETEHNTSFATRNLEAVAVASESTEEPETMSLEMDSRTCINSDNEKGEAAESDHENRNKSDSESDFQWFDAIDTMLPEMDSRVDSDNENTESDHEKRKESESESDLLWFDAMETMLPEMDSRIDSDNEKTELDHEKRNESESESEFLCNICLETAASPVVSLCGHLYCWPCIQQWLDTRPIRQLCPVCREPINGNNMVPLYSRNGVNQEDPRVNVASRQNTEVVRQQQVIRPDFHLAFGIILLGLDFGISPEFGENPEMARRMAKFFLILTFLYNVIMWFLEPYL